MIRCKWTAVWGLGLVVLAGVAIRSAATPVFFGPSPYLSEADIPDGLFLGASPAALETFEDGSLDFGITASAGDVLDHETLTDSVDGDDGWIDGSGTDGQSWFSNNGPAGVTFFFDAILPLPTAAGIVWTDGTGSTTFEAFGPGMVSLGTVGPEPLADATYYGTTAEDRFFGVQDPGGISAVKLSNSGGGIEVDHVQFGTAATIPEPSSLVFLCVVLAAVPITGRRREEGT